MNPEYKHILEEIKRIEDCLKPPPYRASESEHLQAKTRYFFDNYLYEKFHDLSAFVEFSQLPQDKKTPSRSRHIEERAVKAKEELQNMFFSSEEYWNIDSKTNQASINLAEALSYGHYGECTGIHKLCERCCAETIYRLPPTKTWTNEQGAELYAQLNYLKEMEKKIILANSLENELDNSEYLNPGKTKI